MLPAMGLRLSKTALYIPPRHDGIGNFGRRMRSANWITSAVDSAYDYFSPSHMSTLLVFTVIQINGPGP